jgi:hypothetical protein
MAVNAFTEIPVNRKKKKTKKLPGLDLVVLI